MSRILYLVCFIACIMGWLPIDGQTLLLMTLIVLIDIENYGLIAAAAGRR